MRSAAHVIREARRLAGLTQAELARRSGVAQPTISAYERGVQQPSFAALQRLIDAAGLAMDVKLTPRGAGRRLPHSPTGELLRERRDELIAAAERFGATNVRVFGSVARGDDRLGSDIDFLVDLAESVSLIGLGQLEEAFEELLGREVDVVPSSGLKASLRKRVHEEAIPLESA